MLSCESFVFRNNHFVAKLSIIFNEFNFCIVWNHPGRRSKEHRLCRCHPRDCSRRSRRLQHETVSCGIGLQSASWNEFLVQYPPELQVPVNITSTPLSKQ